MEINEYGNITTSFDIISDGSIVCMNCLIDEKSKKMKIIKDSLSLNFYINPRQTEILEIWDNTNWVVKLCKSLVKRKKNKYVKELKKFCKINDLIFDEIKENVIDCYLMAKKKNVL
jgi:hypothetical protein